VSRTRRFLRDLIITVLAFASDSITFMAGLLRSRTSLIAENLFLRKQLALYAERKAKAHRATAATRLSLALLSRFFDWRDALTVVKPDTLIRWHRRGFRLLWRWKSRPRGRPCISQDLQDLIAEMAASNPTWGEERIADELLLKLGIRLSPRTVGRYMSRGPSRQPGRSSQKWVTFVRNHAEAIVACDFFVAVTVRFRVLYVFVIMEVGRRRILHLNVTAHPTADWTLQQFRNAITGGEPYRFVVHDNDSTYSRELDSALKSIGLRVLKTPFRAPQANAFCERLIGTIRRECLDYMIPFGEKHLRKILHEWVAHYNKGRPHSSLGPGLPELHALPAPDDKLIPSDHRVRSRTILAGLHHEYYLERKAA
jgi:putative transposase